MVVGVGELVLALVPSELAKEFHYIVELLWVGGGLVDSFEEVDEAASVADGTAIGEGGEAFAELEVVREDGGIEVTHEVLGLRVEEFDGGPEHGVVGGGGGVGFAARMAAGSGRSVVAVAAHCISSQAPWGGPLCLYVPIIAAGVRKKTASFSKKSLAISAQLC